MPNWREAVESGDATQLIEARRAVEVVLRANPEAFEPLDAEVQILHALGEDNLAERLLDEYLLYAPDSSMASARLAWLRHANGQTEDALAEILALLRRDPDCAEARVMAARWLTKEGQGERAIQVAQEGLERNPHDAQLLLQLGLAHGTLGQTEAGLEAMKRAVQEDPTDEEIARDCARIMLSVRRPAEGFELLEPFAVAPAASPRTWLAAARLAHAARLPRKGNWFLHRLATDPRCDDDQLQHDVLKVGCECLGATSGENWAFALVDSGEAVDALGVELLEMVAGQLNRTKVERLFLSAGRTPHRYPRTIARFLTTFHELTTSLGVVSRWITQNAAAIHHNTPIWAGVGAWHLQRRKYQDAADHLVHWPGRRGVRPWMILLLGRALEGLARNSEANAQFRAALQLPPDHSEPSLRSRLGFNMALEGLAANGHLVLVELTARGRQFVTGEDRARTAVVEALLAMERCTAPEEGRQLLGETLVLLAELKHSDRAGVVAQIERLFVQRANEVIDDPRTYKRER
jgi:tetratricopeptide (TPR) repeat protein